MPRKNCKQKGGDAALNTAEIREELKKNPDNYIEIIEKFKNDEIKKRIKDYFLYAMGKFHDNELKNTDISNVAEVGDNLERHYKEDIKTDNIKNLSDKIYEKFRSGMYHRNTTSYNQLIDEITDFVNKLSVEEIKREYIYLSGVDYIINTELKNKYAKIKSDFEEDLNNYIKEQKEAPKAGGKKGRKTRKKYNRKTKKSGKKSRKPRRK